MCCFHGIERNFFISTIIEKFKKLKAKLIYKYPKTDIKHNRQKEQKCYNFRKKAWPPVYQEKPTLQGAACRGLLHRKHIPPIFPGVNGGWSLFQLTNPSDLNLGLIGFNLKSSQKL